MDSPFIYGKIAEKDQFTDRDIAEAYQSILDAQGELYRAFSRMLTISQQNLLHAIVDGEWLKTIYFAK